MDGREKQQSRKRTRERVYTGETHIREKTSPVQPRAGKQAKAENPHTREQVNTEVPRTGRRSSAGEVRTREWRNAGEAHTGNRGSAVRPRKGRQLHTEESHGRGTPYAGDGARPGRQNREEAAAGKDQTARRDYHEKLRRHRGRKLRRGIVAALGVLAGVYTGIAVYFGFHFYDGTNILGIDCSRKTLEQVKQETAQKLGDYELQIQEREGKTETIAAQEIKLSFVDDGSIDRMMKAQRSYIWPIMLFMPEARAEQVAFSYDRELASAKIDGLGCMDSAAAIPPADAYIGATDHGFEVVSEVLGTTLNKDRTKEVLLSALDAGKGSVSLEEEACYLNPQRYRDDKELVRDAASMSEVANANFTLDMGADQIQINPAAIREWIVEISDGVFAVDEELVRAYVESLAAQYDTFGLPVEFYTSLGTTETLSGGDYGWCINQEATLAALLDAMEAGSADTMQPVYLYSAMSHENGGIGYTYVEICISQQRMWCYENGNVIVDTPVVTGNPNKGNGTPTGGVWAIDAKKRDAILTGEGYTSPVDYWMPFNGDVGIHDLKERAYFGGSIYLSNGSHGCINTPYDQVQIIYNTVSIGTPVIVYE